MHLHPPLPTLPQLQSSSPLGLQSTPWQKYSQHQTPIPHIYRKQVPVPDGDCGEVGRLCILRQEIYNHEAVYLSDYDSTPSFLRMSYESADARRKAGLADQNTVKFQVDGHGITLQGKAVCSGKIGEIDKCVQIKKGDVSKKENKQREKEKVTRKNQINNVHWARKNATQRGTLAQVDLNDNNFLNSITKTQTKKKQSLETKQNQSNKKQQQIPAAQKNTITPNSSQTLTQQQKPSAPHTSKSPSPSPLPPPPPPPPLSHTAPPSHTGPAPPSKPHTISIEKLRLMQKCRSQCKQLYGTMGDCNATQKLVIQEEVLGHAITATQRISIELLPDFGDADYRCMEHEECEDYEEIFGIVQQIGSKNELSNMCLFTQSFDDHTKSTLATHPSIIHKPNPKTNPIINSCHLHKNTVSPSPSPLQDISTSIYKQKQKTSKFSTTMNSTSKKKIQAEVIQRGRKSDEKNYGGRKEKSMHNVRDRQNKDSAGKQKAMTKYSTHYQTILKTYSTAKLLQMSKNPQQPQPQPRHRSLTLKQKQKQQHTSRSQIGPSHPNHHGRVVQITELMQKQGIPSRCASGNGHGNGNGHGHGNGNGHGHGSGHGHGHGSGGSGKFSKCVGLLPDCGVFQRKVWGIGM